VQQRLLAHQLHLRQRLEPVLPQLFDIWRTSERGVSAGARSRKGEEKSKKKDGRGWN
jgi:hypothetical protein